MYLKLLKGLKQENLPSFLPVSASLRTRVWELSIRVCKTCLPCLENQITDKSLENLKSKMMFFGTKEMIPHFKF